MNSLDTITVIVHGLLFGGTHKYPPRAHQQTIVLMRARFSHSNELIQFDSEEKENWNRLLHAIYMVRFVLNCCNLIPICIGNALGVVKLKEILFIMIILSGKCCWYCNMYVRMWSEVARLPMCVNDFNCLHSYEPIHMGDSARRMCQVQNKTTKYKNAEFKSRSTRDYRWPLATLLKFLICYSFASAYYVMHRSRDKRKHLRLPVVQWNGLCRIVARCHRLLKMQISWSNHRNGGGAHMEWEEKRKNEFKIRKLVCSLGDWFVAMRCGSTHRLRARHMPTRANVN